jgi:LPPG:FO 2-phospho-L-lactate transferase
LPAGCPFRVADATQGWGRADESRQVLDELRRLGGDDWFMLGDRDIALHLLRTQALRRGMSLSEVTMDLAQRLGVTAAIAPATDDPLRTVVHTDEGALAFQDYFVRRRCEPIVHSISYAGADRARLAPALRAALHDPTLTGVILCPSNPYLSIMPMLAIRELRETLCALRTPVIAVAAIIGGTAIKGPAAKIMRELGVDPTATVVANLYADFVDAVIVDNADAALAAGDPRLIVRPTLMKTDADRLGLARHCIELLAQLASGVTNGAVGK